MQTYTDLDEIPGELSPSALTIGTFDGMHLGHQAVLKRLNEVAVEHDTTMTVVTFNNHPRSVLDPSYEPQAICSDDHKRRLISSYPLSTLLNLTFTEEFSQQSAEQFLQALAAKIPLQYLVLGYDAHFGKDRSGNPETVKAMAKEMGFHLEYVEPLEIEGAVVSSSRIRPLIREGKFDQVQTLLGRPYSFVGRISMGKGMGTITGYPTANLPVEGMCLPPFGVYRATLIVDGLSLSGIANIGLAPTAGVKTPPTLEVHLLQYEERLYERVVEVYLHEFIREEKKFDSMSELKTQITKDIATVEQLAKAR